MRWLVLLACLWLSLGQAAHAHIPDTEPLLKPCTPEIVEVAIAQDPADGDTPPDSGWRTTYLPDVWTRYWPDYTGTAWYRIQWKRNCPPSGQAPIPVALSIDSIRMAGQIYLGDTLLWSDLHLQEPLSRSWTVPRYWLLPEPLLLANQNTLWVRVTGSAHESPGLGLVQLGLPQEILMHHQRIEWRIRTLFIVNMSVSATLGCIFFLAWFLYRRQRAFGWYALSSAFWVLFIAGIMASETWPFPSTSSAARASTSALLAYTACFCVFVWRFGRQHLPRTEKLLWASSAVLLAATWLSPLHSLPVVRLVAFLFCCLVFLLNVLQFTVYAVRSRYLENRLLAACLLIYLIVGLHDALAVLELLPGALPYTPFTGLVAMAGMSLLLSLKLARNLRRAEGFNRELTEGIDYARRELYSTMEREHTLALENARLQERLHMSHDLHDSLGGSLVRSMALVEQANEPMPNRQMLSILKLLRDDLRHLIDTGSSSGASLPASPKAWMAPLRHRFVQMFDSIGICSDWQAPEQWHQQPDLLQCMALTRITEEALTNVVKHSRANTVRVTLEQPERQELVLCIEDNGVGFDVQAVHNAGLSVGMRSMCERAARVDGKVEVTSQPGRTLVCVTLKLHG